MTEKTPINLYCLLQNRLGAMDRVLNALTHRGIIPARMVTSANADNTLEMMVSFESDDAKALEKLVKFLQKQVYVIAAHALDQTASDEAATDASSNVTPLFVSDIINDYAQRRMANANTYAN
ncbi:MAG: hypothetical protein K0Q50_1319 [Vampirovibrio sp.]|jgi:acetolactate synthase small subunit|nr:hypothetical protein [Vampirovibrio sp.]